MIEVKLTFSSLEEMLNAFSPSMIREQIINATGAVETEAQPKAKTKAAPKPETKVEPEPEAAPEAEAPEISFVEARKRLAAFSKEPGNAAAVKAAMKELGVSKLSAIPVEDLPQLLEKVGLS